jgi:DNA-directed RNA polymerase subunit RPC12/RpoP
MRCPNCDCDALVRRPRHFFERLFCTAAYRCDRCGRTHRVGRQGGSAAPATAVCPRCGARKLKSLTQRDGIDPMHRTPWRMLQAVFGAPLLHCPWCRLQFYDRRPIESRKDDAG